MIEKSIQHQTQDSLQRNELLYMYQYDFRANHFKEICLSWLADMILNGAENGKHTGMILINLQKVFGALYHEIFLGKIKCIGFTEKIIKFSKY